MTTSTTKDWISNRIKEDEITKYMDGSSKDFIDDNDIINKIEANKNPEKSRIRDIIEKAMDIELLSPDDTAALLNVEDDDLIKEMQEAGLKIKKKVYDNRVVTFAPLYMSSVCVNNCLYCGFREENPGMKRMVLSNDEIISEVKALCGGIGHKRLIVVYGEHPKSDVNYIVNSLETIYSVREKTKNGYGDIRRVNVNAAPMRVDELKRIHEAGLGTYQVFQETYHHNTYSNLHPSKSIKGNYKWRLYSMHRALEAGIDDVGIGSLFGISDYKFEVMGLLSHAIELERFSGIGPHTVSFPRLEPASNIKIDTEKHKVNDRDFLKAIAVIRLAIPYTGMIITSRESAEIKRQAMLTGCTQTDASTKIGVGSYGDNEEPSNQDKDEQQFMLGDTRTLDEIIGDLADMGMITSFCTAAYRCGRTGGKIMDLLKSGKEGSFCKLNAILTFKEWLDDFATAETKNKGEILIKKEMEDSKIKIPELYNLLDDYYKRIAKGERDLYL